MNSADQVLSEFVDAWNAGRRPRALDYLRRVPEGSDRDELAAQLSAWLEVAPAPAHDPPTRAAIRREPAVARALAAAEAQAGLWPQVVPGLRERAGLSVAQLAARLVERFGLPPGDEARAAGYVERLERGELEPARVSRRLLDALADLLGTGARTLSEAGVLGAPPRRAGAALFRGPAGPGEGLAEDLDVLGAAATTPAPPAMDELDRLFAGGPDA
jgi:transcriptional regulator with XRE-family HTH domain